MAPSSDGLHELAQLIGHAREQGVVVRCERRPSDNVDAVYRSPDEGGPSITLFRRDPDVPDDTWREAALVAHEFGHHASHVMGWRSAAYFAANKRMGDGVLHLRDEEVLLILFEECVAWRVAEIMLANCEVIVPTFQEHKASSLRAYCKWMLVTDAWAATVDASVAARFDGQSPPHDNGRSDR